MTNHQGDESTLILDFDIANSAQTEYCSTFHFPSVPPWPLGPLGPMDHVDNLDILHHLDHSDRSNHFDNPDWSMIDQEDNCRIRIVYLVLFRNNFQLSHLPTLTWAATEVISKQDQVNNADSAIIFLINHWSVRIVKVVRLVGAVELVQDVQIVQVVQVVQVV